MEKFKQLLFSENGIKIVNMLFFLAFLAHNLVFLVWHTWSGSFFWRSASKKLRVEPPGLFTAALLLLLLLWSC